MANATVDNNKWIISYEIGASGEKTIALNQNGKYIDKPVEVQLSTPAGALGAGSGEVEASSTATGLLGTAQSTAPSSGAYIKVEGEANVPVSTAGWLDTTDETDVSIADVYYPVNEATFTVDGASVKTTAAGYVASGETVGTVANGSKEVTGGGLTAGSGAATISSDGYYDGTSYDSTDKVTLASSEASGYYKITYTGKGSVSRAAINSQVTSAGYFAADANPVEESAATSLDSNTDTKYAYILKSTLSTDNVTPSTSAQTVTIGAGYYPSARTVTVAAMDAGAVNSSFDNSGLSTYFNAGTQSSHDVSVTPQHQVTTAGYLAADASAVDGTTVYYSIKEQTVTETTTTVSGTSATRGTRTESAGWKDTAETLDVASFGNAPATGKTASNYVDISATTAAPALVSGDGLYIEAGWTDALYISLAKLVPDGTDVKGHAEYILQGHTALDEDGTVVTGSIQTWDGSYTIS